MTPSGSFRPDMGGGASGKYIRRSRFPLCCSRPYIFFFTAIGPSSPPAIHWLTGLSFILPVSGKLNPVMWTLVVEVQFYIVLPLVFLAFKRVSPKTCLWLISGLFLVVPISAQAIIGHSAAFRPDINSYFPTALCNFSFGILIAGLDNLGMLKKKWALLGDAGLALFPIALLAMGWLDLRPENQSPGLSKVAEWTVKIASGCLLCYVADPQHPRVRLLCIPWLRWCGIISYEWYLFHQPIILWARGLFGPAGGNLFRYVAIVGGSLLVGLITAALIYRYFSLPILKYGRSRCPR
jgi:peptidoglycan/LPS O-acetylase OafA/YrhL